MRNLSRLQSAKEGIMGVVRWLLILSVFFVLILFGVENMEMVPLKFSVPGVFSYEISLPLFFVVVVSVFAGSVLAGLIGMADHIRMHTRIRKQNKNIGRLENEVKSLRNMPLEEETGDDFHAPSSLKE
jgi:uncharacterized integral membrane protein